LQLIPYELTTALRYLLRSKSHKGFVSFFTIISVICVLIGVAAMIVVLAVMTGFQRELKERVIGMYAHVSVMGAGREALQDWEQVAGTARTLPQVQSATPVVSGPLLLGQYNRVRPFFILATDVALRDDTAELQRYVTVGTLAIEDDQILVGDQAAKQMGFRLGDKIQLTSAARMRTPAGNSYVPMNKEFQIAGLFHTGNYDYDANYGFITLAAGQQLYSLGERVHAVRIRLDNVEHAQALKEKLQELLGPNFSVRTWMDQNPALFGAVQMEKRVMFIILLLISLVASLNIISTLVMVVLQKTKDIGILRSVGATQTSIGAIFTLQGLLISLIGVSLGLITGITLALNIDPISKFIERETGFTFFPSNVYYLDAIPAVIVPGDVLIIAVCAIGLSLIASLFPAALAARLDPVQALRYE
jgi:lipoprotein-releasing system permease protein